MTIRRKRQRGGSALELALMLPWYLFLFIGTFDWGFYAHALISTESAARVAALYTSQSAAKAADQVDACVLANEELRVTPNITVATPTCTASPIIVTAVQAGGGQATASADNNPASQVSVTYTTVGLIPIPLLLPKQATFYRVVQMRLRS